MKFKKFFSILISLLFISAFIVNAFADESTVQATVTIDGKAENYSSCAKGWDAAVKSAETKENVVFTLCTDWKADKSGSFGTGDGFYDGAVYCNASKPLTLDLNGKTIDRGLTVSRDDGAVIYVASELIITDSAPHAAGALENITGGIITGGYNDDDGGGMVLLDESTLRLNGGTIANCISNSNGGAVYLDDEKSSLLMDGAMLYGNHSYEASGGAIYCDDGSVTIKNSISEANFAEDDGGAIYMDDGTISIKNSSFYGNCAFEEGGAVYLNSSSQSKFESCSFINNYSEDGGGAVYVDSSDGAIFEYCNMLGNSSDKNGGALYVNGDKIFLIGGNYQQNNASVYGGGIYVDSLYDINIAGKLVVSNNTVNEKGNNICLQNGTFSTAYLYCGGLYEGSEIWLSSTDSDNRLAIENIDAYQYKNYIKYDSGFGEDHIDIHSDVTEKVRAEGSAIGSGNVTSVIILSVIVTALGAVLIFLAIKKRKGAATNEK